MGQNAQLTVVEADSPEDLTTATLLRVLPHEVRILVDAGPRALRWVETSELEDPRPYLIAGELLLTTGLVFGSGELQPSAKGAGVKAQAPALAGWEDAQRVNAFVERLVSAEVSALGFGLEPHFSAVPENLIQACRDHGLNLWELPQSLPFASIGLSFSRLLESANSRSLRTLSDANRTFIKSLQSGQGENELLSQLTRLVPGRAYLFDGQGQQRACDGAAVTPAAQEDISSAASTLAAGLILGSGPRVQLLPVAEGQVLGFPLRGPVPPRKSSTSPATSQASPPAQENRLSQGNRLGQGNKVGQGNKLAQGSPLLRETTLGALVFYSQSPLTSLQHKLISAALGVLELAARERTAASLAPGQLAARLLLAPPERSGQALADLLHESTGQSLPKAARGRYWVVVGSPAAGVTASGLLAWRQFWDTRLVLADGEVLTAITQAEPTRGQLDRLTRAGFLCVASHSIAGSAEAAPLEQLSGAHAQVLAHLPKALDLQHSIRLGADQGGVTGVIPPRAAAEAANESLRPLLILEPERRDLYLTVLRSWLAAHGSWDGASQSSGMHRNSIRRHIASISEILQRDLADPDVRSELWLSLKFVASPS